MRLAVKLRIVAVGLTAIAVTTFAWLDTAFAGGLIRAPAVGGVSIDAEGVLAHPEVGTSAQLLAAWQSGLDPVPRDLQQHSDLRFVSLRRMEAILAEKDAAGLPVPDEVQLMAGLQRVQFVLVYPEQKDIVLAGPAEGWRVDTLGNVVGQTSGRPVLALDDFMAALRSALEQPGAGMSCSIDPTQEGLARVQQVTARLQPNEGPQRAAQKIAEALGYQTISVSGVPVTSRFARTMVAADFRMKRLAMGFEPAPTDGLPSYLTMIRGGRGVRMENMLPRWWLAANYEPLLRDEAGLAWEIRGQGVKCMTEEDFVNAQGERQRTGQAGGPAQKWADRFTERFEDLANHDSSFGQLRNAMDLAVATTLIVHEGMAEQVGLDMSYLAGREELVEFNAPKRVATQTTFIKQDGRWVISASGGVQISPGEVLADVETAPKLAASASLAGGDIWWWDAK